MTTEEQPSGPSRSLVNEVADWLMDQALGNTDARSLLEKCSLRLGAAGLPLSRTNIGFQILHPLYQAESHTWYRQSGMEPPTHFSSGADSMEEAWRRSPAFHMIENRIPVMRRRLTGPDAILDFEFLEEMRNQGGTDYLGYLELFG
ncbi:MAG: adenylate/guanylate cyclase domain-containing protein, partial [Proteobacteria bacterium]|nr:adenylate/guanylate cyclase domain-containing protein [Pseudomonadota bacterium]